MTDQPGFRAASGAYNPALEPGSEAQDVQAPAEAADGRTADRLAQIRKRVAAATHGPWEAGIHCHPADGCRCFSCWDPVVGWTVETPASLDCDDIVAKRSAAGELNDFRRPLAMCDEGPLLTFEDAEFAAHARDDIPFLLALIDELTNRT